MGSNATKLLPASLTSNILLPVLGVADGFVEGLLRVEHRVLHVGHGAELGDAADVADDACFGGNATLEVARKKY